MHTSTVEQYVKVIYSEQQRRSKGEMLHMKQLSQAMNVTPGTVTSMVKHLAQLELLVYTPRVGVALTPSGNALAIKMLRRHRLIESFLASVLNYDWAEVHADAELLEHAVSDLFIERLDILLDQPRFDPHGDPIPSKAGAFTPTQLRPLNDCAAGESVVVARLIDDKPDFLDLMKRKNIVPGEHLYVEEIDTVSKTLTVHNRTRASRFTMGYDLGAWIMVE